MSGEKISSRICDFLQENGYDIEIKEKKGKNLRYPLYVNKDFKNTIIEELNLSVRSIHALKRAGYDTIGDILDNVRSSKELMTIRNCGKKCVMEIMENICMYQISRLSLCEKKNYAKEMIRLNTVEGLKEDPYE